MDWKCVCSSYVVFSLLIENAEGAWCDAVLKDNLTACMTIFNEARGATSTTICPALSQMIVCSNAAAGNTNPSCDEFYNQAQTATNWYKDHDCGSLNTALAEDKKDPAEGTSLTSALGGASREALVPPTVSPLVKVMRASGEQLQCSGGFLRLQACWKSFEKQVGFIPQSNTLCRAMDVFLLCYQTKAAGAMLTCNEAVSIIEKSQQMFDQYKCATYNVQNDVANMHDRPSSASFGDGLGLPIWMSVLLGVSGVGCLCACLVGLLHRGPKFRSANRSMYSMGAPAYASPHSQGSQYNVVQMPIAVAPMQAYPYQQGAQNYTFDQRGYTYTPMPANGQYSR
jgi:hypothetical protein